MNNSFFFTSRKERTRRPSAFVVLKIIFVIFHLLLLLGCTITPAVTQEPSIVEDSGGITLSFCPQEDCENQLLQLLQSATTSIHCAVYEVDLQSVQELLLEKAKAIEVAVVTDDDYYHQFDHPFVKADKSGLMHNKFCIIDRAIVSTGSMNPTYNDAHKNNNNLLIIKSEVIAQRYEEEFQELWNGIFKKGEQSTEQTVQLGHTQIEAYFCPEDHCAERVKNELKKAQQSIQFMTFSFTHDGIGNILLLKHLDGVQIEGIMEVQQIDKDSQFQRLVYNGINVIKDKGKYKLHHKVFIIDSETIITGSFNPTNGGDTRNDENILIIKDREIAHQFEEEFKQLFY